MAAPMNVTSQNWLRKVLDFRRNPVKFLNRNGFSESAFVMDIQKELYDEDLSSTVKIHLLLILQEYSQLLLPNNDSVEQCLVPLVDVYHQTGVQALAPYRAQYLTTVTTILLDRDVLDEHPTLFTRVADLLLDLVGRVNATDNWLLRSTACQCLQEVETHYPTVLVKKLPHLYSLSQLERTPACQAYVSLVVTVLRNGVNQLTGVEGSPQALSELIVRQTEALKPLQLGLHKYTLSHTEQDLPTLPPATDGAELKRLVSFVIDQSHVMTSSAHLHAVLLLAYVVKTAGNLSPIVFKSLLLTRLSSMYNVVAMFTVLKLMTWFGSRLFSDRERTEVSHRVMALALQPSLSSAQRLLMYEWLLRFPREDGQNDKDCLPPGLDFYTHRSLFPMVYDGVDTKLKKLNLLSLFYIPGEKPDAASATLIGCLVCLHQPMNYGIRGRGVVNLFRALYIYYTRHRDSIIVTEIQRFIFGLSMEQPKFTPHVLDFLNCISQEDNECQLSGEVLSLLTNQIVSTPVDDVIEELQNHLMVLEAAARDTRIYPKPILRFLENLLNSTNLCRKGDWKMGNAMLAIIRTMLQHHETDDMYSQIGDVLHMVVTSYRDPDIQDRAKFLYSLLTRINTEKLSTILLQAPYQSRSSAQSLTLGQSGLSPSAPCVQRMARPVLTMERSEDESSVISPIPESSTSDPLEAYTKFLNSPDFKPTVEKTYNLRLAADVGRIYAVNIHLSDSQSYLPVSDLYLASLADDKPTKVKVTFTPTQTITGEFRVRAIFTTNEGVTMASDLDPLQVSFQDLFHPLPLLGVGPVLGARLALFTALWTRIEAKDGRIDSGCVVSCLKLDCSRDSFHKTLQDRRLHRFIVENEADSDEDLLGMFLPPMTSCLLRVTWPNHVTFIKMATDNWKILNDLDQCLKTLVTDS